MQLEGDMKTLIGLGRLFVWDSKLKIQRNMQYRMDFLLGLIFSLFFSMMGPIFQYIIFTQTRGYPGWNLEQIILFQGILLTWVGIRDLLFAGIRGIIMELVRRGDFDRLLLKPYPPIGLILTSGFTFNNIGTIIAGLIITTYSMLEMRLGISLEQIVQLIVCLVCGILLSMAIQTIYSCIVIMVIQMGRIGEFLDNLLRFAEFPLDIFSKSMRVVFMTVIPIIIWTYLPAQILLGRAGLLLFVSCIGCVLFMLLGLKLWNICLKRYTSAGG